MNFWEQTLQQMDPTFFSGDVTGDAVGDAVGDGSWDDRSVMSSTSYKNEAVVLSVFLIYRYIRDAWS